mgnify:CR=1 FL=1
MKKQHIILVLRLAVAVILIQTLRFKFTADPVSVYIFETVGLEPFGRIGIGVLELIAGILILIPRTVWAGALLSLGLMSGAIFMHLTKLGIEVQEDGGLRPQTGMEKAFAMNLPYSGLLQHLIPTKAAPKNKAGNMSPGFRNKMMSAMQVARDPQMRSRSKGKQFFVPAETHPLGQGRRAGVYMRTSAGNAKKMLNFIPTVLLMKDNTNHFLKEIQFNVI